jgi:hypothetical protein
MRTVIGSVLNVVVESTCAWAAGADREGGSNGQGRRQAPEEGHADGPFEENGASRAQIGAF